jgi:hypothetical protein
MEKMTKCAGVFFLLAILLGFASSANTEDISAKPLYLKNGSVTRCDSFWKGAGDFVWCNKGTSVVGYPVSDIDMKKTFKIPASGSRLVNKSKKSDGEGH